MNLFCISAVRVVHIMTEATPAELLWIPRSSAGCWWLLPCTPKRKSAWAGRTHPGCTVEISGSLPQKKTLGDFSTEERTNRTKTRHPNHRQVLRLVYFQHANYREDPLSKPTNHFISWRWSLGAMNSQSSTSTSPPRILRDYINHHLVFAHLY